MSALPIGGERGGTPRRGVGREKEAGQGGGASVDEKGVWSERDRVVGEKTEPHRVVGEGVKTSCEEGFETELLEKELKLRGELRA